jgi:hypothetical protein
MEYGLIDICNKMLDNADMKLDLSCYPSVSLNFIIYGSVDEKFWEVQFQCKETIELKLENENDVSPNDFYLVLNVNVVSKSLNDIPKNIKLNINNPKLQEVWLLTFLEIYPLNLHAVILAGS